MRTKSLVWAVLALVLASCSAAERQMARGHVRESLASAAHSCETPVGLNVVNVAISVPKKHISLGGVLPMTVTLTNPTNRETALYPELRFDGALMGLATHFPETQQLRRLLPTCPKRRAVFLAAHRSVTVHGSIETAARDSWDPRTALEFVTAWLHAVDPATHATEALHHSRLTLIVDPASGFEQLHAQIEISPDHAREGDRVHYTVTLSNPTDRGAYFDNDLGLYINQPENGDAAWTRVDVGDGRVPMLANPGGEHARLRAGASVTLRGSFVIPGGTTDVGCVNCLDPGPSDATLAMGFFTWGGYTPDVRDIPGEPGSFTVDPRPTATTTP